MKLSVATLLFALAGIKPAFAAGVLLSFQPVCNGNFAALPGACMVSGSEVQVQVIRFYISAVELYSKGKRVWQEQNSYHLVDFSNPATMQHLLGLPDGKTFDKIRFNLGIDSVTNVSGAMDGDLDPAKGMYWAWQSGYINFKMEGSMPFPDGIPHEFQFHLGGYASPHATLQTIELAVPEGGNVKIGFDAARFLAGVNISEAQSIMSPGANAVRLSAAAAGAFTILP